MKKRPEKAVSLSALRKKLYSAVAMLLVASIMMVSSSYAWLVLSTAPEVTGIETQIGANGSLEIALLNTDSYNDITKVTEADIDESVTVAASVQTSNLSWGNLVSLGDANYGLGEITLNPSRLNIQQDGNGYKINSILLKTPKYGEDGRITGLEQTAVSTTYDDGFNDDGTQKYGVRAIGTVASMNAAQLGINAARSALATNMSSARTAASNALNASGDALGNVAVGYALGSGSTFTSAEVQAMKALGEGLKSSLGYIDAAIRQLYVGYICTAESGVTAENFESAKASILDTNTALSSLEATYNLDDVSEQYDVSDYISILEADMVTVQTSIDKCQTLLDANKESYTQDEIMSAVRDLVNYENMTMGGYTITQLKDMTTQELAQVVLSGGLNIKVPSGSGILSNIADFAGDYTARVTIKEVSYGGIDLTNQTVTMETDTTVDPVYLTRCGNILKGFTAGGEGENASSVITDFYGYVLDLAFRTNAVASSLLLQTDEAQRVYSDGDSPATQGGGSYMSFTSNAGLSATKMIKLMGALRVVFVDKDQQVLSIAALDTTVGKDAYTVLDAEEQEATGKYAVLTNAPVQQNSDYITQEEYDVLPDVSVVQIDAATGEIKAPLYLHDFHMTESTAQHEDDSVTHYTGGITLDAKGSNVITDLEENVPMQVSAIVYLDGSFVNNSMVAADSAYSMTGTLNLQFASSGGLVPMENQGMRNVGKDDSAEEEEPAVNENEDETPAGSDPANGENGGQENGSDPDAGTDDTGTTT